ncbi:MAG: UDP-N-acetylmuramoyl-tripeptide--D-alanyl-D-alanine ligase [Lutibacter sp.]|jgi:UDP-N-acetylmuramoyl-tripeptide--D-alanyl-D-alanine ligase|nr:UDP-N-acetylmuramoyl-tripeptide--D-alanyl-D-alanine ligase [Lutibacter sp.]
MNIESLYQLYTKHYLVDTDTRRIREGSLFFALKGPRFNANTFAEAALKAGAAYAIIEEEKYVTGPRTVLVNNVLQTLQTLANHHRKQLDIPVLALTGSNGKTTTKELINCILSKKYQTVATQGNLNNHIGVPLTLLSMKPGTEIGIVEMGANHLKEIELLCGIAAPDYGYITNFGKAHLEGFGSYEGVIKGKSELYDSLRKTKGKVFLNTDDPLQVQQAKGLESIEFNQALIPCKAVDPTVEVSYQHCPVKSQLIGQYNYTNIAAAITIGAHFGVETARIAKAIAGYVPSNNRSQIIQKGSNTLILDAYNANPSSMQAALENFEVLAGAKKYVILGDMFELGKETESEHQAMATLAESLTVKKVFLIGKAFATTEVTNASVYPSVKAFTKAVDLHTLQNSTVLIKGSRGMALEQTLDLFEG